jgi:hypothetical protein
MVVSQRLRLAVRTSRYRSYELAKVATVAPGTFSAWVNGIVSVHDGDPRIIRVGAALGVTAEQCFEPEPTEYLLTDQRPVVEVRR